MNIYASAPAKNPALLSVIAYAMVFFVFLGDWYTPNLVAVGLAYEAPVVLAGLKGSRTLTLRVAALGVLGLILGWFMDYAIDSFHFSAERIENRLLSLVSLMLISSLVLMLQQRPASGPVMAMSPERDST